MTMNKIRGQGLHERVVREIGRRIVSGELPEGKSLPRELVLLETLGVSRTALREAMRVLSAKGLVAARQKTGTAVRPFASWNVLDPDVFAWRLDSDEFEQVIGELRQLRRIIEPQAASLAAAHAKPGDIAALRSAYRDMASAARSGESTVGPDVRFHREIIAASGNSLLAALGQVIAAALAAYFALGLANPDGGPEPSLPEHKAVLDAIVNRDPAAAQRAMEKLIDDSEQDARAMRKWRTRTGRRPPSKPAAARRPTRRRPHASPV